MIMMITAERRFFQTSGLALANAADMTVFPKKRSSMAIAQRSGPNGGEI